MKALLNSTLNQSEARKEEKAGCLLLLSYRCSVTINALWLFHTVPLVGVQCVNVVFPYHTHLFPK